MLFEHVRSRSRKTVTMRLIIPVYHNWRALKCSFCMDCFPVLQHTGSVVLRVALFLPTAHHGAYAPLKYQRVLLTFCILIPLLWVWKPFLWPFPAVFFSNLYTVVIVNFQIYVN